MQLISSRHGVRAALLASALVLMSCAQSSVAPHSAKAVAQDDPVPDTPSYWSDPPTMSDVDDGWENWPDWEPRTDIPPNVNCSGADSQQRAVAKNGAKKHRIRTQGAAHMAPPTKPFATVAVKTKAVAKSDIFWEVQVASWNILNFGTKKAYYNKDPNVPRTDLLDKIAAVSAPYDIVFFQELLQDWNGTFPIALSSRMPGFNCHLIGPELGWAGRKEYYGVCAKTSNATVESISMVLSSSATSCVGGGACAYVNPANNASTCPRQIWMRPPGVATVTIVPRDDHIPRYFAMFVNHLKPSYNRSYLPGGGKSPTAPPWFPTSRPGGFPAAPSGNTRWPLETAAVYYELQAINANKAALSAVPNNIILGDLNADCTYLPPYLKNAVLPPSWHWYIDHPTNTGRVAADGSGSGQASTGCAYDRFILDDGAESYNRHKEDVFRTGIANRLNGKQVSDHYLIHMTLGEQRNKKRKAEGTLVALSDGIVQASKRRPPNNPATVDLNGTGVSIEPIPRGSIFYVINKVPGAVYAGTAHIPLHDVRPDGPTPVTISNGTLIATYPTQHPLTWTITNQTQGTFKFVLDANGDGYFDADQGDLVNNATGYDFLVYADQDVVLDGALGQVGDNGRTRDFFSSGQADGVYALSEQITQPSWNHGRVDVYIVSDKLLHRTYPWFTTWAAARGQEAIILNQRAVTVPFRHVGPIVNPTSLPEAEFTTRLQAAADGSLFFNAWDTVENMMREPVQTTLPPPPPPAVPSEYDDDMIAIDGDGCATLTPGVDVNVSADKFNTACKGANSFSAYYGNNFNVVFDTNEDGVFDDQDMVDAADTSQLSAWFQSHTELGPASGAPAATIAQYQNILLAKLNYPSQINLARGTYDGPTQSMSSTQYCDTTLSRDTFNRRVVPETQVGFTVLDESEYQLDRSHRRYVNMQLADQTYDGTDGGCLVAEETAYLSNMTYSGNAQITAGQGMTFSGTQNVTSGGKFTAVIAPPPAPPVGVPPQPVAEIKPGSNMLVFQSGTTAAVILILIILL